MMPGNVKLNVKGYKRIIFQGHMFLLEWPIYYGRAKTKLAMLALLYCGKLYDVTGFSCDTSWVAYITDDVILIKLD